MAPQCPKLRVHPAPGVHIFTAGCTFFEQFIISIYWVHGAISRCTVLGEVHPVSAQNKSLISDTAPFLREEFLWDSVDFLQN